MTEPESVIHACPVGNRGVMACCGLSPLETPTTDQLTLDPALVTCRGPKEEA